MNYRLVMSNSDAWYLDCGYGSWLYDGQGNDNNWCSPMKGKINEKLNNNNKDTLINLKSRFSLIYLILFKLYHSKDG